MKIEHAALWTGDLERMKAFYIRYFHAVSSQKYTSSSKPFESYFLTFDEGARLELMQSPAVSERPGPEELRGYAHLAVSLGSKQAVRELTETMRRDGVPVWSEPRTTGDGYYESVVLDPDGNRIELTV